MFDGKTVITPEMEQTQRESLKQSFDSLEKTAMKCKAERDKYRNALHRIAYDVIEPLDASNSQMVTMMENIAKEALESDE